MYRDKSSRRVPLGYKLAMWAAMGVCLWLIVTRKKGDRLGVRGPLAERQWTGRDGVERTETVVTAWVLHLHRRKPAGTTGAGA